MNKIAEKPIYIGKNIEFLLKKYKIKQCDLAEILNKKKTAVNAWLMRGAMPPLNCLMQISELFCIPIDELLYIDLENSNYDTDFDFLLKRFLNSHILKEKYNSSNNIDEIEDFKTLLRLYYK